jgi:hypothetical protein
MATTVQTRATSGRRPAEPDATRRTAFVGGFFYVLTFASSIVALLLIKPAVDDASYIVSGGADTRVLWGCFLDLVNAFAGVGSAVALYSVVKRQHEGFALGFVTTRIYEMAVIMIGVVSLFAVVTLRQEGVTGADSTSLVTAGRTLVAVRDWSFLLGPGFIRGPERAAPGDAALPLAPCPAGHPDHGTRRRADLPDVVDRHNRRGHRDGLDLVAGRRPGRPDLCLGALPRHLPDGQGLQALRHHC